MTTMIQIRNVPDDLHRKLKSRAALSGMSLSEYLLNEIRQTAEQLTMEEMRARLALRPQTTLSESPADIIRKLRGPI